MSLVRAAATMNHLQVVPFCLMFIFQTVVTVSLDITGNMKSSRTPLSIRWSHATNSRAELRAALKSDVVDFIEGDVLLGAVIGHSNDTLVPIMAHPPDVTSDLSFSDWLRLIKESNISKGIKVDFKDLKAVESCLKEISRTIPTPLSQELWLNADVLVGPGQPTARTPLPAETFVDICKKSGPVGHVLSIGWTTNVARTLQDGNCAYSWNHVLQMLRLLDRVPRTTGVTFPVRLSHLTFAPLTLLLSSKNATSLTVWSHATDPSPKYEVMNLLMRAYPERIYADLPREHDLHVMKAHKNIESVMPPATLTVSSWKATTDLVGAQRSPWGSPYAIVVPGPGLITVEVTDPCRLQWVGLSGDLAHAASDNKDFSRCPVNQAGINAIYHDHHETKASIGDTHSSSQVSLRFIGSGEAILFLEQPISAASK